MPNTISPATIEFLVDLKFNNNREWFAEHKERYVQAKADFEVFIDELIDKIAVFDPTIRHQTAADCVFRIYRDVRFSKDKSPYKTHFGAHITAALKKSEIHSRAGYYIHIEPGDISMLAGGAYLPEGKWLKGIRQAIADHPASFKKVIEGPTFKKYFGSVEGEKLKTSPKDFPKDHPEIEWLKHKSFLATHKMEDDLLVSSDFLDHCDSVFKALHPIDQFLNDAARA